MKKILTRTADFFELQMRLRDSRLAWKIHQCHGCAKDVSSSGPGVIVRGTGLLVNAENAPFLARASSGMRHLTEGTGAQWQVNAAKKFEVRIGDLCFEVSSSEDVF